MPRYRAILISGVSATVTVEADSAEEAYDKALYAAPGGLCHQCAHTMDGPDDWDVEGDVEEVTE